MDFDYVEDWNPEGEGIEFDEEELPHNHSLPQDMRMENLNTMDYNLNSPLISDELDSFIQYLYTGTLNTRWDESIWKVRKEIWIHYRKQTSVQPSTKLHNWFGEINIMRQVDTSKILGLLRKTQEDAEETGEILLAFLRGWLNKNMCIPKKDTEDYKVLKWGALFLDLYVVVLCLNANSKVEKQNLAKLPGVKYNQARECFIIKSKIFTKMVTMKGFVFFVEDNKILSREFILMMKDVYSARFHSLLSMEGRVDRDLGPEDHQFLSTSYEIGDRILLTRGNDSYDLLKMVEPLCNVRLCQLAQLYRPLIDVPTDFPEFVKTRVLELSGSDLLGPRLMNHILSCNRVESVLTVYGSFRHWGHPFLDISKGLEKLYNQVNCTKDIDISYANALASDLAKIVLRKKFLSDKKWYVNSDDVPPDHPLKTCISNNTWPTPALISDIGDVWHELPLKKCFDLPDAIDPSIIYSDKSHSMTRSEITRFLSQNTGKKIPTKKVLKTLLEKPATDWPAFLRKVSEEGLPLDSLTIGLKGKEREMKKDGRYFSLMSWDLREYFVYTEYLIKEHFVPLFEGLTMADDLTTVMKKMLDTSNGQGSRDYKRITIANHIDYEKWNNHQRIESNGPVFRVMGQFLGYPDLIYRTHEFFQKSWIYYADRGDDLYVVNDQIKSKTGQRHAWNGQLGGLEGLRQKGWSVLNLLVIAREGIRRNTLTKTLAQGDNQVICTHYEVQTYRTEQELLKCLDNIYANNDSILSSIETGTKKLGLIINQDETMRSADYLNYGKIPVFRGNVRCLETKKWSRVSCVTNDQLPNMSSIMSTVSSAALGVSHYSPSPLNSMFHYNFLGNMVRQLIEMHNPALRGPIHPSIIKGYSPGKKYKSLALYLDPSLGGVCGTSLARFLTRLFPDPITEGLSFWRLIYEHSSLQWVREIALSAGSPTVAKPDLMSKIKLLENPLALNIVHGIDALTLIKNEIKSHLYNHAGEVRNTIIREAIIYGRREETPFVHFLFSIKPLFPRFLSEYRAASYLGIVDSMVGLFQNSRTIRNYFSNRMSRQIDKVIYESERSGIVWLHERANRIISYLWTCSSKYADQLRENSWGRAVVGATIPHPLEMIHQFELFWGNCRLCDINNMFVSVLLPMGLVDYANSRGPYPAYLGSNTKESTSILSPWEKEAIIPLIKRAEHVRNAIGWFVLPGSNLGNAICQNLESLTGEDWSGFSKGFKRTGSALHRFSNSRQSSGGFTAQSPSKLTRMFSTTNTLEGLKDVNYDFMFQSLLLYSQITAGELHDQVAEQGLYHFHLSCKECLRPIEEVILETEETYTHPLVSDVIESWLPPDIHFSHKTTLFEIRPGNWDALTDSDKSFHIGRTEAFLYGESHLSKDSAQDPGSLFPLTIQKRIIPQYYLDGVLHGLVAVSATETAFRRSVAMFARAEHALLGSVMHLISKVSAHPNLVNLWRGNSFLNLFTSIPHKLPPSYPTTNRDLSLLGRNYLNHRFFVLNDRANQWTRSPTPVWVFADTNNPRFTVLISLSLRIMTLVFNKRISPEQKSELREIKDLISMVKSCAYNDKDEKKTNKYISICRSTTGELRHACKNMCEKMDETRETPEFSEEAYGESTVTRVIYTSYKNHPALELPRYQDPLISGLRLFQCATGAHYKLRTIIKTLHIKYNNFLCAGDGSGGLTAWLLRNNLESRGIFNSLLELTGVHLKGSAPSPPSAVESMGGMASRCVNAFDCWKDPSNLACQATWTRFKTLCKIHGLRIDLVVMDMEVRDSEEMERIESLVHKNIWDLLVTGGTLIFKSYLTRIFGSDKNILETLGKSFKNVDVVHTSLSSSRTSEVYVVAYGKGTHHHLHPDYSELLSQLQMTHPLFQSEEEEFARARRLLTFNWYKGVPMQFRGDPYEELSQFLLGMGVETGIAYSLGLDMRNLGFCTSMGPIYGIFLIALNSICNLTRGERLVRRPPTDSGVMAIGVLISGFYTWYSYCMDDLKTRTSVQKLLGISFPFWFGSYLDKKKDLYYFRWSLNYPLKYIKCLHLDSKMASICTFIRILRKIAPNKVSAVNAREVDLQIAKYNTGLTVERFESLTGLGQAIGNDQIIYPDPSYLVDIDMQIEYFEDQAWTN
ncbi:MAG: RNA-dependent RNA polymerase [Hangzhou rhabdovirus 4]|uniref:RNA-directed RNA polymerase L n=1 Tax=Hangzhou rhabdovirus 4 TaxID=2905393 RepID=A0A8K1XCG2_9RHAB|nr:MAG: RNA-dependent RNA polymerase [Hangzhou rhabdovirus 4]